MLHGTVHRPTDRSRREYTLRPRRCGQGAAPGADTMPVSCSPRPELLASTRGHPAMTVHGDGLVDHSAMTTQEALPATGSREPITTFPEATHDLSQHFVYLYRDPRSNSVRYVGKATTQPRARLQRPETH